MMGFRIPKPVDRRTWCAFPAAAIFDERLRRSDYRALATICLHVNELGQTYLSQKGMAAKLGISRELAGRYCRRLMSLGYLERVKRRGRGYITSVNYTTAFMKELITMAQLDEETIARGKKWLEKIRKDLEARGTRPPRQQYSSREHNQVPQTPSHTIHSSFLDDD